MATNEIKTCIFRVLGDLIKSDSVISADEMDTLDNICVKMNIDQVHKNESYSITLADAVRQVVDKETTHSSRLVRLMEECALKDGECCREEAILISAVEIIKSGKGQILSMPFNNRPILSTQIVFVDSTYNPPHNILDTNYEELSRIAEMAGFELIYIPHVAKELKEFKLDKDLERLLYIINPTLSESDIANKVMSLQNMDNRFFYLTVLNGKLQMSLSVSNPIWLIRLPNSVVNGQGYANFLCYDVEMDDIKSQLIEWADSLNKRLNPYSIIVNKHSNKSKDFLYGGFHKALLDVMAAERVDDWEIKVYVRAGSAPVVDKSPQGKKHAIAIYKGKKKYPVLINGREAAFFILLLCGSAVEDRGVDFEYEEDKSDRIQKMYIEAYRIVSYRDNQYPDITSPSTFRPIKTRVMKALEECGIKEELHLFKPTRSGKTQKYYIPLISENVKIVNKEGETPLLNSTLLQKYRFFFPQKNEKPQ